MSLLRKIIPKRVPVIRQMSQAECGPACLAMIFAYYQHHVPLYILSEECQTHRNGVNAKILKNVAENYGYICKAYRVNSSSALFQVTLPVILYWDQNHYVVLEKINQQYAWIVDPAMGRKKITLEELDAHFSQVVFTFSPTDQLKQVEHIQSSAKKLLRYAFLKSGLTFFMFFLSFLVQLIAISVPFLMGYIIDQYVNKTNSSIYQNLFLIIAGLLITFFLFSYIRSILFVQLQRYISSAISKDYLEHLLQLPLRFFEQRNTGDLATRMNNVSMIREILSTTGVAVVLDMTLILIYFFAMLVQSPFLSGVTFIVGAIQVMLMVLFLRIIRHYSQQELAMQATSQSYLTEALRSILLVKSTHKEDKILVNWLNMYSDQMKYFSLRFLRSGLLNSIVSSLTLATPLILLLFGMHEISKGNMTLGGLITFNSLAMAFLAPINSIITYAQSFQILFSVFERLQDALITRPEIDKEESKAKDKVTLGKVPITFEDVSFAYQKDQPILEKVSFTIYPGEKVALVGPTGSGKSSIVKLLLGLYKPVAGHIRFGEHEINEIDLHHLRSQVGVVLQETFLFNESIEKNIAFFEELPIQQVQAGAQLAALDEEIKKMPLGYHTIIGENGQNLSGGQRQRLSIARALATQPSLLILDEATSHLDSITERKLNETFKKNGITQLIIAHRLSTIMDADQIIVLDQGKIQGIGTHEILLKECELYRNLWKEQGEKAPEFQATSASV
ncbi:peptidase domain-containing ABC transporter [Thermoflavimicrobium dichotomicum]|uniref:ABC-type bacteriocin/lantibiotic exporter, contains an N-terminal double-glycine peptidase domain n=1 Tax=Thermoflavimicrobium dichotomicum TaxID=46223 RepID=A0A1I3SL79_9BACL|nr:peptidase domain-containing ABC transporter [Thermoflavimicrobium dichotomicum]SFJ59554.1 ABC-type bacteriocin/lantibiotic exporter, contains an N-terminal double-glycine peptidase domain [Thermoflavimicrobium dichotomicum]